MTTPEQYIARHLRHNFIVNSLDGAFYWFGYSFIAPTIILPLYISHFTKNPLIIGLIPFINTAGFLLPQLFTSNFVERAPVKKFFPVTLGLFLERVPVLALTLTVIFFARTNPLLAVLGFFLCYTWYTGGAGSIIVGWQDMIAKIIPVDIRGRFFGIANFIGNVAGILGALAVPLVLERFEFPQGYVIAFSLATVLIFLSWVWLSQAREPAVPSSKPRVSQFDYLKTLPAVVRRDKNFLRFIIFFSVYSLSGMAAGFLIVYAAQTWHLSDAQASGYNLAMQIGTALSNLFFGFLADRKGHKVSLELTVLVAVVSLVLSWLATSPLWFYPIFFLRGAIFSGAFISGMSIVFEFCREEDRPTYIGLANTIPGVFSSVAPLIGGLLAQTTGYPALFVISAALGLVSFVLLRWTVKEPRHLPKASTMVDRGDAVG